jgi:hypothetical protein
MFSILFNNKLYSDENKNMYCHFVIIIINFGCLIYLLDF